MSGFNNNQNGMGVFPNGNKNQAGNVPSADLQQQINQVLGIGASQMQQDGTRPQQPQQQLDPATLALIAQRQQGMRQQQQQVQQNRFQSQNRPQPAAGVQNARQASASPQLLQQILAQTQTANRSAPSQTPIQQQTAQQPSAQQTQAGPVNPQTQRALAALARILPPNAQEALKNGSLTSQQLSSLTEMARQRRLSGSQSLPGQQPQQNQPTPPQQPISLPRPIQGQPNLQAQFAGSSPATTPQPLPQASRAPSQPPRVNQPISQPAYHPSVLSTPPQSSSTPTRVPSPPRAEGRRASLTNQQTASPATIQPPPPPPAQAQRPPAVANPSTDSNAAANPTIASAISNVPPPTFKLDETKLKAPKKAKAAKAQPPPAPATSSSEIDGPASSRPTAAANNASTDPARGSSASTPPSQPPVASSAQPQPTQSSAETGRPANPLLPRHSFASAVSQRAEKPERTDGRHVEHAGERRKGAEGMRGTMRNELARLMYAAGDDPEPDSNSVDYMEDLVTEFLGDLCRPVKPLRFAPNTPYQPIPLTSSIVRDRLSSRPVFKKYLDRFDTMSYLSGEISKNRRVGAETYTDLIESVGRDFLEIDANQEKPGPRDLKRKGRGKKGNEGDGVKKEEGESEMTPKKKPGPKKGWKAKAKAMREGSVDTGAPAPVGAPSFGPDGRKIKKKYVRKKREDTAPTREGSIVREGSVASGVGSPAW